MTTNNNQEHNCFSPCIAPYLSLLQKAESLEFRELTSWQADYQWYSVYTDRAVKPFCRNLSLGQISINDLYWEGAHSSTCNLHIQWVAPCRGRGTTPTIFLITGLKVYFVFLLLVTFYTLPVSLATQSFKCYVVTAKGLYVKEANFCLTTCECPDQTDTLVTLKKITFSTI